MGHFHLVVLVGFEPTQTEPESGVLPLHHRTIPQLRCKVTTFFLTAKTFLEKISKKIHFILRKNTRKGVARGETCQVATAKQRASHENTTCNTYLKNL